MCQTTTTATAPIRTRSTTRSRSSGVAAASARTVPPGRRSDRADPEDATPPACAIRHCDAIRWRDAIGCRARAAPASSCPYPSFTSSVKDGSGQVDELRRTPSVRVTPPTLPRHVGVLSVAAGRLAQQVPIDPETPVRVAWGDRSRAAGERRMADKDLARIAALLRKAEGTDNEHEADAFLQAAQRLATLAAVDLAVARAHTHAAERRATPTQRTITIGDAGKRGLRTYVAAVPRHRPREQPHVRHRARLHQGLRLRLRDRHRHRRRRSTARWWCRWCGPPTRTSSRATTRVSG